MQEKITKALVQSVQPTDRDLFVWDVGDRSIKGFGLKVTKAGKKQFVFQYRLGGRGHPTRRLTIGEPSESLNVTRARDLALELRAQVQQGIDPAYERKKAIKDRRDQELDAASGVGKFEPVLESYLERHVRPNLKSAGEVERVLNKEFLPDWKDKKVADITRRDVKSIIERIRDRGSRYQANAALDAIRPFFKHAISDEWIEKNPAVGIIRPVKPRSRDRVLSDDELKAIWNACEGLHFPYGKMVRLLILTAQRRSEVAGMAWAEVDLETGLWEIPSERAKNKKAHIVHLSSQAVGIIESIDKVSDLALSLKNTPLTGYSLAKKALDEASGVTDWRFHDIRRTVTTGLAGMGIAPHVADKILNHSSGMISGVGAVYQKHEFLSERKAALEAWGKQIDLMLNDEDETNVVPLRVL